MFGKKKWKMVSMYFSKIFTLKTAKQCKDRWYTTLDPLAEKNTWTIMEEFIFFECQREFGNKWATISKYLPGRTDNNIKNHFYSNIRKNIRRFQKKKYNFGKFISLT
jgi:hypothetical protein